MMLSRAWMVVGLLLVVSAVAAQPAPQPTQPAPQPTQSPRVHHTACSLAESMASRLGAKKMTAEAAQRTCKQLAPSMNDTETAEFMRCCTARLQQ